MSTRWYNGFVVIYVFNDAVNTLVYIANYTVISK